jgi:hypothetical protein
MLETKNFRHVPNAKNDLSSTIVFQPIRSSTVRPLSL